MRYTFAFVGLLTVSLPVSAAMYKCTDTAGNVAFMDKPCKEQKQEILKERTASKPSKSKSSETKGEPENNKMTNCADMHYLKVTKALDKIYQELGRPKVHIDNMKKVFDRIKLRPVLEEEMLASRSLSAMGSYIFIDIRCSNGDKKEGEWRP